MKMFRFSCFHSHVNTHKQKKTVQLPTEAMKKMSEDSSETRALKDFTVSAEESPLQNLAENTLSSGADHVRSPSSIEHDWKSEECKSESGIECDVGVQNIGHMKKSLSLGSGLAWKGRESGDHDSEDDIDQGYSCGSHNHSESVIPVGDKDPGIDLQNQNQEAPPSDSLQVSSNMVNNESIFSIGDPRQSEKEGCDNSETRFSGEGAGESSNHTPRTPPAIVKSSSVPNISYFGGPSSPAYLVPRSRSSEDLNVLDLRRKDMSFHDVGAQVIQGKERDDSALHIERNDGEHHADDSSDAYNYVDSAKDWIIPVMDELNKGKSVQIDSSLCQWVELPSKDFKIKRIEKWVMELHHSNPLEETDGASSSDHLVQGGDAVLDGLMAARIDSRVTPGMEAAKKYLSSLSISATAAQLANHGLLVIPFLSVFASLKVLNLSGNAIVRITAGALPRGLHILNLSKNNISTIEGLRELTRLRVLDLSYNRLLRIGHGLASCSSLKELYLAGNKLSEVEGLHRLLKLNVLDLRFNKISTSKGLGQLAANYNSLQAISVEGNPAQKNVGDEQLKKYLQGLLPHLAYFNRQSIKAGTLKDGADRAARLGISAHQSDRGLRPDLKTVRKASHALTSHKTPSSSTHGRKSQAVSSPKLSRGSRHGRLPPSGLKTTTHQQQFYDFGSKLVSFRSDFAIRRSRSEGTLGAI